MGRRVFLTGGSGFVGTSVVGELARRGWQVLALTRGKDVPGARVVRGAVTDRDVLVNGMSGCSAVIHLIGIIDERPSDGVTFRAAHVDAARAVIDAATAAGVRRYVHMSALGARVAAASEYHRTKWQAEELVRASRLEWTIIRPSVIHGPGGEFMRMASGWARGTRAPWLFMPYFGSGVIGRGRRCTVQPVYVGDVARAFADALDRPGTIGRTYEIGGSRAYTWPAMLRIISRQVRRSTKAVLPVPAWYAKLLTRFVPRALLPFNRDQVIMSQEDSTCDLTRFREDFGWEPAGFVQTLRTYAREL